MDPGGYGAGADLPWRPEQNQPQWPQRDARLPPLGPTPRGQPSNKRGLDRLGESEGGGGWERGAGANDGMEEEMESPEVRSFKRLKLEGIDGGGGSNSSASSSNSIADHYNQGIHRPNPHHPHGQNHGNGRPPIVPGQHPANRRQASGAQLDNHHSHEFAPIRANPYQIQHQQHRHQQHHAMPPSHPDAGMGPRCNSFASSNSTDQSAVSYSGYPQYNGNHAASAASSSLAESGHSRDNGASYSGMNHVLGQLHAQRRMRQQQSQQQLSQAPAAQYHPPTQGHHRRNTLSPNWGMSSNVVGGDGGGGGGAAPMGTGQHDPGRPGDLHPGQHQDQGHVSRQRVPSWRRRVQLPSSSNLY